MLIPKSWTLLRLSSVVLKEGTIWDYENINFPKARILARFDRFSYRFHAYKYNLCLKLYFIRGSPARSSRRREIVQLVLVFGRPLPRFKIPFVISAGTDPRSSVLNAVEFNCHKCRTFLWSFHSSSRADCEKWILIEYSRVGASTWPFQVYVAMRVSYIFSKTQCQTFLQSLNRSQIICSSWGLG